LICDSRSGSAAVNIASTSEAKSCTDLSLNSRGVTALLVNVEHHFYATKLVIKLTFFRREATH